MPRVFDEADYRQRLDQVADEISTGEEVRLIVKGLVTGEGAGPLNARKAMSEAKTNALRQARREMIRAIRAEDDRIRATNVIPTDVWEIATGSNDELVKVP
jgi:hypothetical protein